MNMEVGSCGTAYNSFVSVNPFPVLGRSCDILVQCFPSASNCLMLDNSLLEFRLLTHFHAEKMSPDECFWLAKHLSETVSCLKESEPAMQTLSRERVNTWGRPVRYVR